MNPIPQALNVLEKVLPSEQEWATARAVLANPVLWEQLWQDNTPEHTRAAQYAIAAMDLVELVPAFVQHTQHRLRKEASRYPLLWSLELTAVFNTWIKHTPTPTRSLLELDKHLRGNVGYGGLPKNSESRVEQALFANAVDVAVALYSPDISTPTKEFLLSSVFSRRQTWRSALANFDALVEKGVDSNEVLQCSGRTTHVLSTERAQSASVVQLMQLFKRGVRLPEGIQPPPNFSQAWARHEKRLLTQQVKSKKPSTPSKRKM